MSNSLFERFGNQSAQTGQPVDIRAQVRANPRAFVSQIKADPAGFMRQMGVNIPEGVDARNPMSLIQALYGNPPPGIFGRR